LNHVSYGGDPADLLQAKLTEQQRAFAMQQVAMGMIRGMLVEADDEQ
jgi:hypothetical protein